jgi:hypothetical protein
MLHRHMGCWRYFFPDYAPELNPDEFVWSHMKRTAVARPPCAKARNCRTRLKPNSQRSRTPRSGSIILQNAECRLCYRLAINSMLRGFEWAAASVVFDPGVITESSKNIRLARSARPLLAQTWNPVGLHSGPELRDARGNARRSKAELMY